MILNISSLDTEHPEMFCKKMLWKILQDSQKNNWVGVSFLITRQACTFIKNDIATQVFYEIFENAFFIKNLQATVSVSLWWKRMRKKLKRCKVENYNVKASYEITGKIIWHLFKVNNKDDGMSFQFFYR